MRLLCVQWLRLYGNNPVSAPTIFAIRSGTKYGHESLSGSDLQPAHADPEVRLHIRRHCDVGGSCTAVANAVARYKSPFGSSRRCVELVPERY